MPFPHTFTHFVKLSSDIPSSKCLLWLPWASDPPLLPLQPFLSLPQDSHHIVCFFFSEPCLLCLGTSCQPQNLAPSNTCPINAYWVKCWWPALSSLLLMPTIFPFPQWPQLAAQVPLPMPPTWSFMASSSQQELFRAKGVVHSGLMQLRTTLSKGSFLGVVGGGGG